MKIRLKIERLVSYGKTKVPFIKVIYNINNFYKRKKYLYQDMDFIYCKQANEITILNPKVATRSLIEKTLNDPNKKIIKNLKNISKYPGTIHLVLRDPLDRFVSFWDDKIGNSHPFYINLLRYKYSWFHKAISIKEFLQNLSFLDACDFEKHFCLQSSLFDYLARFDRKIFLTNIQDVSGRIANATPIQNVSMSKSKKNTRNEVEKNIEIFEKIYQKDIVLVNEMRNAQDLF